jgi:RNA polymerase sigma-B factor
MITTAPTRSVAPQKSGAAEVNDLVRCWQADGDTHARERLVELYTPLARSLARRYNRSSVPSEDLLQVAYVGLLKAIDRFDVERGGTLQAFAVPTVLGELRRYFRDSGWSTHVPRGAKERALEVRAARDRLTNDTGRAPTVNQIAEFMEIDIELVIEGLQALRAYETAPLDAPSGPDEESAPIVSVLGSEDAGYALVEDRVTVQAAIGRLSERKRGILKMRFQEELSQQQIADRIGCSQMQVSRLLSTALRELRETIAAPAEGT